jgi:3-isopropylmalate/(R)-2-methylmalate dehydratase small subunit
MGLEPIKQVTGSGVYVPGDDIDTDQIIPARYLKCVTFDALGAQLFYDARFREDGSPKPHPLNDARFKNARIMLSGANFGCGSSREHAPQSIHKAGFRAIVAESFAEIFFGNCTTLGIPCVAMDRAAIREIAGAIEAKPDLQLVVDLEKLALRTPEKVYPCELKQSVRDALVAGAWDPIAELLKVPEQVAQRKAQLPYPSW